ncbi:MAG: hypothetical protein ABWX74_15930 [Aeromicrobium sp.]
MPQLLVPMRWADLDVVNHVNNSRYAGYTAEARAVLERDGDLPSGLPPGTVSIQFVAPLLLSTAPVVVESRYADGVLEQEVRHDGPRGAGTLHARVTTTFTGGPPLGADTGDDADAPAWRHSEVHVRQRDIGPYGRPGQEQLFEIYQESRVLFFGTRPPSMGDGSFVLVHITAEAGAPLTWRGRTYPVRSRVASVGTRSFVVETEIVEDGTTYLRGRAVVVGFDVATETSRAITAPQREQILAMNGD